MMSANFNILQAPTTLKKRLKTAINVLRNRPVVFRVGITDAKIYLPQDEGMWPAYMVLCRSHLQWVDKEGRVVTYPDPYEAYLERREANV